MSDINSSQSNDNQSRISANNLILLTGLHFPVVKINSVYIRPNELVDFRLSLTKLLPEISIKLSLDYTNLLVMNMPKDGDLVSIFIRPSNDSVKSVRMDFIITDLRAPGVELMDKISRSINVTLRGELHVPHLYNEGNQWAFIGTSKEAVQDVAERYGLGFAFNDEEDTDDKQVWYNYGQTGYTYIKDLISHAWKDEDSFFNGWVDQYYNLTLLNVNKMLGLSKADDGIIDMAFYLTNYARHNHDGGNLPAKAQEEALEMIKLFTNHPFFNRSTFSITKYAPKNTSSLISRNIGHTIESDMFLHNQNLFNDRSKQRHILEIEPVYTTDKLGDHIILRGRAGAGYSDEDSGESYADNASINTTIPWTSSLQIMSDGDSDIENTDTWSGNCHKHYKRAYHHNIINNQELNKLQLEITCPGLNLHILRGEKVPVLMLESEPIDILVNTAEILEKERPLFINMFYSGWFVITGIIYEYSQNPYGPSDTNYQTRLILSRREWVPPENIQSVDVNKAPKGKSSSSSNPPKEATSRSASNKTLSDTVKQNESNSPTSKPKAESSGPHDYDFTGAPEEFIEVMVPVFEDALIRQDLDPKHARILAAQSALESAWGAKATGKNNYSGIKDFRPESSADYTKKWTHEEVNGVKEPAYEKFRNFSSLDEYADYKVWLLNQPKYDAFSGGDAEFYAGVRRGGYATDSNYASSLGGVVKSVDSRIGKIFPDKSFA